MDHIFFNGWQGPIRTAVIGVLAYVMLVVFLRISGKRTLSKMNAFDFIVTIALGSTLASILLNRDVTLVQGGIAFVILIGLQYLVTWSSVRVGWVRKFVTGEPALLLFRGELLQDGMRRVRVTEAEIRTAVRAAGLHSYADAEAVVLETDASFSVIGRVGAATQSRGENAIESLTDVRRP